MFRSWWKGIGVRREGGYTWRSDLQTPLLAKQQSQRADICMFLMSNVLICYRIGRDIMHHCQCASRRTMIAMRVFETGGTVEAEPG